MEQQKATASAPYMSAELKSILASGEELLRHSADKAGEEYRRARVKFEAMLADAKRAIAAGESEALYKARLAKAQAELYVQANPWQTLGYTAVAAGIIGVAIGMLIGRR